MIHSHCYIENAPYTEMSVPCGAIEEVDEILNVIRNYYDNNFNKTIIGWEILYSNCILYKFMI